MKEEVLSTDNGLEQKTKELKIFLAGIIPDSLEYYALEDFIELETRRHNVGKDKKPVDPNYGLYVERVRRRGQLPAYKNVYEKLSQFRLELRAIENTSGNPDKFFASKNALGKIIETAVSLGVLPLSRTPNGK